MNLSYHLLDEPFSITYGDAVSIVIENIFEYRKIISSLYRGESSIHVYDLDDEINKNEVEFISDIYNLEFNDRKIKNLITNKISELMDDEYNISSTVDIKQKLLSYFEKIFFEINIPIDLDSTITNKNFLKSINWDVSEEYENEVERIIDYLDILVELIDLKVAVTKNADLYLSEEDYSYLIEYLKKREIIFITIERSKLLDCNIEGKKTILFDKDLCRVI